MIQISCKVGFSNFQILPIRTLDFSKLMNKTWHRSSKAKNWQLPGKVGGFRSITVQSIDLQTFTQKVV